MAKRLLISGWTPELLSENEGSCPLARPYVQPAWQVMISPCSIEGAVGEAFEQQRDDFDVG